MDRRSFVAAIALNLAGIGAGSAAPSSPTSPALPEPPRNSKKPLVRRQAYAVDAEVLLYVFDGPRALPIISDKRTGKYFIESKATSRFHLNVVNRHPVERLAILSVDGKNTITGEPAGYRQQGYILPPYGFFDITGWGRDPENNPFQFNYDPMEAQRLGYRLPANSGVIGMAIYESAMNPPNYVSPPSPSEYVAKPAPVDADAYRNFIRASNDPILTVTLHYDSRENLIAQGLIVPERFLRSYPFGNPFPVPNLPTPPSRK